ncbi:hypothetical protein GO684_00620 [Wolbachia endosymbiont of Litomosoides brasiliensis]|uniref:hypothetical protein n=1 Tax=Wolbachia endosymbiont of Litomosoides brasiliensis TaxID=1812117 RepID=UPI001589E979|nr:hypothetical protein [Wolbachia endosymbiont of Litomosoides brasiliensis]NUY39246.1 hypothetical protein [Wolbachia endosymbiont of Litomosoides brasiliensis]
MTEAQGPNIAEWQAQQRYQEHQGEKSGFGLGHSDSVATIVDGMKWLFNFHEGAISAYSNVLESLVSGNLATLFGKSANMFGIKFFESFAEHFSGRSGEGMLSEGMDMAHGEEGPHQDDFPHASDQIANNADGLRDMRDAGDYHGQSFSPSPSPLVDDGHGHELSGQMNLS